MEQLSPDQLARARKILEAEDEEFANRLLKVIKPLTDRLDLQIDYMRKNQDKLERESREFRAEIRENINAIRLETDKKIESIRTEMKENVSEIREEIRHSQNRSDVRLAIASAVLIGFFTLAIGVASNFITEKIASDLKTVQIERLERNSISSSDFSPG